MSEMVERLRKVFDDIILWADDKYEIDTTQLARAAIEATREPTPEMVEAMKGALHDWRDGLDGDERMLRHTIRNGKSFHSATDDEKHAIRWRAGIDAALKEKP